MPVAVDALTNLPIFRGLDSVELEELASHLVATVVEPNQCIIKEGENKSHPMYILLAGNVEVAKFGIDGRDHVISSLSAPSVFGEIEILVRRPPIASVIARSRAELAMLNRGVFDELCELQRPSMLKVIKNLATTLAYRLAATDGRMAAYFNVSSPQARDALGKMQNVLYTSWHSQGEATTED
jgi:CRP-like cAMP-binding protein